MISSAFFPSFFEQFKNENRITHYNWDLYDTSHVVFKPKNMTAEEKKDE